MNKLQALIDAAAAQPEVTKLKPYTIPSRGMLATLALEAIGDNLTGPSKRPLSWVLRQAHRMPQEQRTAMLTPGRRPWVARITGLDERYGLAREFLKPLRDYRDSNSTCSRGVMLVFQLEEGSYFEVNELLSWKRERRYFCRSEGGSTVEVQESAVRTAMLERVGR